MSERFDILVTRCWLLVAGCWLRHWPYLFLKPYFFLLIFAFCLLPSAFCTEYTTIFRDYVDNYINAGTLDLPPKGNITNGLGLFTMRRSAIKPDMTLDRWALDSLCLGQWTKQLGFVRW
jgi:hypothetical protein